MSDNDHSEPKQLKGFYGKVKISVKVLDILIVAATIALVAVLGFGLQHRGYTITFDTTGGTTVESQKKLYGETVDPPEDPTREGYTFEGWYTDEECTTPWDMESDTISEPITLYACWQKNSN